MMTDTMMPTVTGKKNIKEETREEKREEKKHG